MEVKGPRPPKTPPLPNKTVAPKPVDRPPLVNLTEYIQDKDDNDKDTTLPSGSQMFWVAIGISLYVYIWIVLINMDSLSIVRHNGMVLNGFWSVIIIVIHYAHCDIYGHKNILHKINPLFFLIWMAHKLVRLILNLNKYLDKIFD